MFAVRSEFQTIGAANVGIESLDDFLVGEIDDGDGAVLGVGGPDFFVVGGDVEAFVTAANSDEGLIPVGTWRPGRWTRRRSAISSLSLIWLGATRADRDFFDDAYSGGADVGGDDALGVG